ncbi:hypothetical protein JCM6882_004492 [Rhodosporidiobolus microsporus]
MASLFSSRLLLRHPRRPPLHSLPRPPAPPSHPTHSPPSFKPPLRSSSSFSSSSSYSPYAPFRLPPDLPREFTLVHRSAINHQTPLTLAGADRMDDLPVPNAHLEVDGEGVQVPSESGGGKVYTIKRFSDNAYSCTCLSWTFQKKRAIDVRSCKHLRGLLGDAHEDARTGDSGRSKTKKAAKKTTAAASTSSAPTAPAAAPAPVPQYAEPGAKKRPIVAVQAGKKAKKAKVGKGKGRAFAEDEEDGDGGEGEQAGRVTDPESASSSLSEGEGSAVKGKGKAKAKAKGMEEKEEGKGGVALLLANKFELLDGKRDPEGWWVSEKLDGVRAYWDGQSTLYTRTGNVINAPASFLAHLPRGLTLDGELFLGRDRFDETSGIVRTKVPGVEWGGIRYLVFDIPSMGDSPFESRQAKLESLFPLAPPSILAASSIAHATAGVKEEELVEEGKGGGGVVWAVRQERCGGWEDLRERLRGVKELGGEGLMLRQPLSPYIPRRSSTLLKVKTFHDAEAVVVGYEPGKGKYEGMCGALVCEMQDGRTRFSVGSGLTDERRGEPPAIGATITYRFQDLTKAGVPRFPTFVGERWDLRGAKDAVGVGAGRS